MDDSSHAPRRFRFGLFEADLASGRLLKRGAAIPLQDKPFCVLALLLERSGELVTREDLRARLWPDGTFVDYDEGLNTAVKKLRSALADSADQPVFIETVARHGYRFIAPVIREPAAARVDSPGTPAPPRDAAGDASGDLPGGAPLEIVPVRLRWTSRLGLGLALFAAATIGVYVHRWWAHEILDARRVEMTKVTDSGSVTYAAIAPDGRYVAYSRLDGGNRSLWLRQVKTRSDVQIAPSDPTAIHGLTFSPDGESVFFIRADKKDPFVKHLYVTSTLGGPIRQLIADVDSPVSFSPDGRVFVYERCSRAGNEIEMRLANPDGGDDRLLAVIHDGSAFHVQTGPTWSPDGRVIAVAARLVTPPQRWVLIIVSVADGHTRELFSSPDDIGRPQWLAGGTMLLVPHVDVSQRRRLWTVSYPAGEARLFTNDLTEYRPTIDATPDGRLVAAIASTQASDIWIAPGARPWEARQLTFGGLSMFGITETADKMVLALGADGRVWKIGADGSSRVPFVSAQPAGWLTPCGRFVVFAVYEPGRVVLMRVDADGAHETRLASGDLWAPTCASDGQWVYYVNIPKPQQIWKVPIAGGEPTRVAAIRGDGITSPLSVSPDGTRLAYYYSQLGREPSEGWHVAMIPVEGDDGGGTLPAPAGALGPYWSADGRSLRYQLTDKDAANIWEQPVTGGAPKQLTRFTSVRIYDFRWSPDGTRLLLTRGNFTNDVVLLAFR
jgi:DNA-binding winged helix-turn-helix (wHTH) protein/Tol biopolymer transport system component